METNAFEQLSQMRSQQGLQSKSRKKPIPMPISREEIYNVGQEQLGSPDDDEFRALWYYLYLTGCRISEALGRPGFSRGIASKEIEYNEKMDSLVVTSYTEKNRHIPFRNIPIPLVNPIEAKMAKEVWNYREKRKEHDQIFQLNRHQAFNRFHRIKLTIDAIQNLYDPVNRGFVTIHDWRPSPHYLRHCRLTHLVTLYSVDINKLQAFAGWSTPIMASTYVHLDWKTLLKQMEKEGD